MPVERGRDLISAFKQDAIKLRYKDWDELIDYCDRSASPVGRYLLDQRPRCADFLDREAIRRLAGDVERGAGHPYALLEVLMLEIWLSEYLPRALSTEKEP